jgi:uncharacterized cupin superfamily protein
LIAFVTHLFIPYCYFSWQLATGNRQPATGNRQLATGNWQPTIGNRQLATGNWQPATGNRQLATGNWQPATGNWQPATGNWPLSFLYMFEQTAIVDYLQRKIR